MFFKDSLNPELSSLVKNKRVAIVGPAYYLTGKSQGKKIDEYDVVIRVNQFSVKKDLYKDWGSRTDIMFHSCGTPWMAGLKEQVSKDPSGFDSLKMVVCPIIKADHSEVNFHLWPEDHISACAYNFKSISTEIPFYWIGIRNYMEVYRYVGCQPYTGIMTIVTLLHYPIEELYVTGFDFYTGERIYQEGHLASVDAACEEQNSGGSHGNGCNDVQIKFLNYLYDMFDEIVPDNTIKNILSKI